MSTYAQGLAEYFEENAKEILDIWLGEILGHPETISLKTNPPAALKVQSAQFFLLLNNQLTLDDSSYDEQTKQNEKINKIYSELKAPILEIVTFVLSLKDILFRHIRIYADGHGTSKEGIHELYRKTSQVLDQLLLYFFRHHTQARESLISDQSRSLLELSTPVIKLWDEIILLPLVGVLDTARAKQTTEQLLYAIVKHEAIVVILDVTGVPIIDTSVARHLIKTISAARMLGAETVVTGISPEAAQTLVQLGIDLSGFRTRGLLQAGVKEAFSLTQQVVRPFEL